MKKMLILCSALLLSAAALHAQTTETNTTTGKQKVEGENGAKAKVKPRTTVKDKAYNAVHRHKKRSHGVKVKATDGEGNKVKSGAKTEEQQ